MSVPVLLPHRLKVLQVGKYYFPASGGIETYLRLLCEGIRTAIDLKVLVSNEGLSTVFDRVSGVSVIRAGSFGVIKRTPLSPLLAVFVRRSRADVLHLHEPNPAALFGVLASGFRGKIVVTYHMDIVRQKYLAKLIRPFQQRVLRRAESIIVTSKEYLESSPVLKQHADRCRVIPIGIDLDRFQEHRTQEVSAIRANFGKRIVLCVGRLVSYKGFDVLIRAMQNIDGICLMIGKGPEEKNLRCLAEDLGVLDRIKFLGEVQDTVPYYQACDVFVLPSVSRVEAFGIVQVEAMACGKPVVNTDIGTGTHTVSLHNQTGFTVRPGHEEPLAAAIETILGDEVLKRSFGAAAKARSREFTIQAMSQKVLEIYTTMMASPAET